MSARRRRGIFAASVFVALATASTASAQAELVQSAAGMDSTTARSLGMADALGASGISTTAIWSNPAGVGIGSVFHAEGWYGYAEQLGQHVVGVASVDSTTPVAGGLGISYTYTGLEAEENNHYDFRSVVAIPILEYGAIGVGLKYLRVDWADAIVNPPPALNDFSLDAGAMFAIDRFFIGVYGTNLTNLDHPLAPLALTAAGGLTIGPARVEFDATFDWSSYDEESSMGMRYAAGTEVLLFDLLVLRAGYRYEDIPDVHGIAAGIGYVDLDFAVDFGFQQDLSGDRSDSQLAFSARYFIQ